MMVGYCCLSVETAWRLSRRLRSRNTLARYLRLRPCPTRNSRPTLYIPLSSNIWHQTHRHERVRKSVLLFTVNNSEDFRSNSSNFGYFVKMFWILPDRKVSTDISQRSTGWQVKSELSRAVHTHAARTPRLSITHGHGLLSQLTYLWIFDGVSLAALDLRSRRADRISAFNTNQSITLPQQKQFRPKRHAFENSDSSRGSE